MKLDFMMIEQNGCDAYVCLSNQYDYMLYARCVYEKKNSRDIQFFHAILLGTILIRTHVRVMNIKCMMELMTTCNMILEIIICRFALVTSLSILDSARGWSSEWKAIQQQFHEKGSWTEIDWNWIFFKVVLVDWKILKFHEANVWFLKFNFRLSNVSVSDDFCWSYYNWKLFTGRQTFV